MMTCLATQKSTLRKALLARRAALTGDVVQQAGATITDTLQRLPAYMTASTLCSYVAIDNEVQTMPLLRAALAEGKRVVLPRTHFGDMRHLTLHLVADLDGLLPGRYGILEPPMEAPQVHPAEIDLFVIPGVAFDARGNRLGYGAGFYDSVLAHSHGTRIALAYGFQLVPLVPAEPHDIPMHLVVTEVGVVDCRRGQQPSDHLRLRNLQCYGHHGAYPAEREQGIRLAFDVDLRLDVQVPGLTDDLGTAVNYPEVYRLIDRVQSSQSFSLLEALAERTAAAILHEFPAVAEVTLTVRKFNPPVGGLLDAFEVQITRSRLRE